MDTRIWVASPDGEGVRCTTAAKDGKGEDEHKDLSTTVQGGRQEVVVLDEQLRLVLSQVELREKPKNKVAEDGGIDAHKQPAHVPEDNGSVEEHQGSPSSELTGCEAVHEVEGDWDTKADDECNCNPLVTSTNREHVLGDRPGYSKSIELLDICALVSICLVLS